MTQPGNQKTGYEDRRTDQRAVSQFERRDTVPSVAWIAIAAVITVGCSALVPLGDRSVALIPFVLAILALLCMIPRNALPVLSLALLLFVPTDEWPVPHSLTEVPINVLPALVWICRSRPTRFQADFSTLVRFTAALFAVWALTSAVLSGSHSHLEVEALVAQVAGLGAMIFTQPRLGDPTPTKFLVTVVPFLGVYAIVEKWVLKANPLYGSLYARASPPLVQRWSTYRATTTMGHPLVNATVFAVALTAALAYVLDKPRRSALDYAGLAAIAGGLVATVSRGALVGAAVGAIVVIVISGSTSVSRRLVVGGVVAVVIAIFALGALNARDTSAEGQASVQDRTTIISDTTSAVAGHALVGVGPGQAETYRVAHGLPGSETPPPAPFSTLPTAAIALESAYAETVVDIGYPGAVLLVLVLIGAATVGIRARRSQAGPALLVAAICIAGFNALDAHPQLYALLGLLAVESMCQRPAPPAASANSTGPPPVQVPTIAGT